MKKTLTTAALLLVASAIYAQISMEKTDSGFLIKDGIKPVFFYQSVPKSENGKLERSNYIHPLWNIDGNVLTEDFPADHPHHRGIFWAWHQLWIGDKKVGDGWELKDFSQEITEIEYFLEKGRNGVFSFEVLWTSPLHKVGETEKPFIKENTRILIYPVSGSSRRIDFEIRLLALDEGVKIGGSDDEKGYGGFSARVILPGDVGFRSTTGTVTPETEAVEAGTWMDISGRFGKRSKPGGIVLFSNPKNPGYPEPWILRNNESMQNIVFPGREPIAISTVKPLILKYSLVVYKGKMNIKKLERIAGSL